MSSPAQELFAELQEDKKELRLNIILTTIAALALLLGIIAQFNHMSKWLEYSAFLISFLAGGTLAAISAFSELIKGKLDIDLLMVLAALAAAAVGEARDGAILLFLFSLAGTLEHYAMGNTKRAVASLMELRPDTAHLHLSDGSTKEIAVEELKINDLVIIKPSERIPVDATIISGQSAVDQAAVTGESMPVDKTADDKVFAGTVNGYGILEAKVSKLASESTLAKMIDLVTQAQEQRSPSERFSDWFGARYTVFVLLGSALALGIFLLIGFEPARAFYKAATLLVVASPCAIVISVPAAVLSALAAAAKGGVLFKGGAALEDFGNSEVVALDKTGTLTEGSMQLTDISAFAFDEDELLKIAASIETHSEHPIAISILKAAKAKNLKTYQTTDTKLLPGKGISVRLDNKLYWAGNRKIADELGFAIDSDIAIELDRLEQSGKTKVLVANEQKIIGLIGIADTIRDTAKDTIQDLKELGIKRITMLTGDHPAVAHTVAKELGIAKENVYAGLLPEDKLNIVKELSQSAKVAFVGDGVNDAAALAVANVGVAMGSAGSDVALEAADVALLSDDLTKLAQTFKLAKRANRVIKQNFAFALGIMLLMVIVTLFWNLPLPLGVIGHEGGTLLVVANGLRLMLNKSL